MPPSTRGRRPRAARRDVSEVARRRRHARVDHRRGVPRRARPARRPGSRAPRRAASAAPADEQRPELDQRIGELESAVAEAEAARVRGRRGPGRGRTAASSPPSPTASPATPRSPSPSPLDGVTAVLSAARRSPLSSVRRATSRPPSGPTAGSRSGCTRRRRRLGGRVDLSRELSDDGWWILRRFSAGLRRRIGELRTRLATSSSRRGPSWPPRRSACSSRSWPAACAGRSPRASASPTSSSTGSTRSSPRSAPQAGGVAVRLRWDVDPDQPDAVKAARALLLRDPADLDRRRDAPSLQEFVRTRVDQARAELEANAPWEARLRETLDYRAWHRFTLQLAHRDWEGYQPATAGRLQRLSTGERSIALHLPMLASIAAHYADERRPAVGLPAADPARRAVRRRRHRQPGPALRHVHRAGTSTPCSPATTSGASTPRSTASPSTTSTRRPATSR